MFRSFLRVRALILMSLVLVTGFLLGRHMWRISVAPTDPYPEYVIWGTKARVRMGGLALRVFREDQGQYPPSLEALKFKRESGPPYALGTSYDRDAWGNALVYRVPGNGHPFDLYSKGLNGIDESGSGDDVDFWSQ